MSKNRGLSPDKWARLKAIEPKPPRVLHQSKTFTVVKTDTRPKLVPTPGKTYMRPDTIERIKRRRESQRG